MTDAYLQFRDELVAAGLLVPTGVEGLFGKSGLFEAVVAGLDGLIVEAGAPDQPTVLRFPPVLARSTFERTDYLRSFPDLIGSVHSFRGTDKDHAALLRAVESGADWTPHLSATEITLCPAACYPLYPMSTGTIDAAGKRYDVFAYCFRHEPSPDPARMQVFRMHEFVRVGTPEQALSHRDAWIERGLKLLTGLGLPVVPDVANDPFFGRAGRMLAVNQRDAELKYELLVPICSEDKPTAIASSNYHMDHFGTPFSISLTDGSPAHSACVGFGMERITLALFKHHGLDPEQWPKSVRSQLLP